MFLNKFSAYYQRFEKYISVVGLIYGFIFTTLTLTRVDTWLENFWIVMHLLLAGFAILALTYYDNRSSAKNTEFHFYLTLVIQFAFGGLFSTFFVFYWRSAALVSNWFFLVILLILLVGNELWKKHYERLALQVSLLFVSFYLFLIFLLPVLFHRLGTDLFVASGILSLIGAFLFTLLLKKFAAEKFKSHHNLLKVSIVGLLVLFNVLYFTNLIPPIPLALKDAGVYHQLVSVGGGAYQAAAEPTVWTDYFDSYPAFHGTAGEAVYVFTAIFSPADFILPIIHQWQYYDAVKKEWTDSSRIVIPITGGRAAGYRLYSFKRVLTPGLWRVLVFTESNQLLGQVGFTLVSATSTPKLIIKSL